MMLRPLAKRGAFLSLPSARFARHAAPCSRSPTTSRITVNHIMAHPYLCGAQLPRESRQAQIRSEMSIRYQMTRAFNHSAIVNTTTTAGSAPSSGEVRGVEASAVVAASAGAIAQPRVDRSRQHNGDMFNRDTRRSSRDDDNVGPPEITAEAAGTITGGFVARGWPRDVIKALERVLHDMGAQVREQGYILACPFCRVFAQLLGGSPDGLR